MSPTFPAPEQPAKRRFGLSQIAALLALLAYLAVIQWVWGWSEILAQWRHWSAWKILLVLVLIIATYAIRAARIRDYFRSQSLPMAGCFKLTLLHNLANNLLPMRSGEASFPLLMKSYFDLPLTRTTGTLLWFRLLDLHAILAMGAGVWFIASGTATLWWLALAVFVLLPLLATPLQAHIDRRWLDSMPARVGALARKLLSGMPAHLGQLLRSVAFTWLNWGLKLAVFAVVVQVFAGLPLASAFIGALGGELSSILPIHAPAGVGTYEAGVVAGAVATGSNAEAALQGAVNLHIVLILATGLGGLLALLIPVRPLAVSAH